MSHDIGNYRAVRKTSNSVGVGAGSMNYLQQRCTSYYLAVFLGGVIVSWCFKSSQPQRITSGLKETFIKRYIVDWTNKADKDQKSIVRKRRAVGRIYGIQY